MQPIQPPAGQPSGTPRDDVTSNALLSASAEPRNLGVASIRPDHIRWLIWSTKRVAEGVF